MGLADVTGVFPGTRALPPTNEPTTLSLRDPDVIALLLHVLDDTDEGYLLFDKQEVLYVNEGFERLSGYARGELLTLPDLSRIFPDCMRCSSEERLIVPPVPERFETAIYHKNGHKVELDVTARAASINGRSLRLITVRDITARKQAERASTRGDCVRPTQMQIETLNARIALANRELAHSFDMLREQGLQNRRTQEQLRRVISSARCLLWHGWVFRTDGKYRWSIRPVDEPAALRFLPLDIREGERYFDARNRAVLPDDTERMRRECESVLEKGESQCSHEFRCFDRDENVHWLYEDVFVERVTDTHWRLVGICTDITDRKQREEEINELNARLQTTNDELVESLSELQQFAFIASHDLQEPLRTVTNYLQLLERRYDEQIDEEGKSFLTYAVDAAKRMGLLWRDLLDYSRLQRNHLQIGEMDCEAVLIGVLTSLQPSILEEKAEITHDPLPMLVADRVQFGRVLANLLLNALKYRRAEPPRIHISAKHESDAWFFSVRDNGIGIEEQYYDRIFVMFQRLHDRKRYTGTGIGLAICKRIVERHGGQMWVESQVGVGSTFYFSIPDHTSALLPFERS